MMGVYEIVVRHTFDAAHRVVGHEGGTGKCARLHGHTYGVVVTLRGDQLDSTGFLVDFAIVKQTIDLWDHRTLLWHDDPIRLTYQGRVGLDDLAEHVVRVPFNPTAEHMARSLAETLCELPGVDYASVVLSETPKTSACVTARRREAA